MSVNRVRTELRRQPGGLVVLDRSDVDELLALLGRLESVANLLFLWARCRR